MALSNYVPIQFIENGRICDKENCPNVLLRKSYPSRQLRFFCSEKCQNSYYHRMIDVVCAFCGKEFRRRESRPVTNAFGLDFCVGHADKYRQQQTDKTCCGPFYELFQAYQKFARGHYRSPNPANQVRRLLAFLTAEGLVDINQTTPEHISAYVARLRKTVQKPRADLLKVFFDFLLQKEFYRGRNPVRGEIHYTAEHRSEPRPCDEDTFSAIWRLTEERGDTRAKLIVALFEEAGPLPHQICNIRLPDLDRARRRISIRDPSGDGYAGWTLYRDKTERWLETWLEERPADCGHDYLLVNSRGNPLRRADLKRMLNGVVCDGEAGLPKLSLRALRDRNVALLRQNGMDDQINMKLHCLRGAASLKRFDRMLDQKQIEQYRRAVSQIA